MFLSLQSAATSVSLVLEQATTWFELSKEETSTLGTILLETVESTMLAALLIPSGNASQMIQTEYLGNAFL
jgi:egf-like module-containing mucin-like hormone receptor-like protein 1